MAPSDKRSSSDVPSVDQDSSSIAPSSVKLPSDPPPPLPPQSVIPPRDAEKLQDEKSSDNDVLIVNWDGPDDPQNPRNWSYGRKWAATVIVSSFTFISPVASAMVAPAASTIARDFGIHSSVEIAMTISVFVLAYAVGPLFLAPISEMTGRSTVLLASNLFFLAFNLGCGFAQSKGQLIAFRFLSGLGGSAPLAIGGGVIGDCWDAHERGRAISIYSLAPLLGPAVGPVAGAWIVVRTTWRWVFWATTIVGAVIQVFGFFYLRETYAPVLLERKAQKIRNSLDAEQGPPREVRTALRTGPRDWKSLFAQSMFRPFVLFFEEPIVQLFGLYMAFVYGTSYLTLTTIPGIFANTYHQSIGIAGLHYIALALGLGITSQANARLLDKFYVYFRDKNGGVGRPEHRLLTMFPGSIILPIGLLIVGWASEKHVHWIVVDIGLFLIGSGIILLFLGIQTYVVDAFTTYAASALAAVACFRSLAGFGFPLFAPPMYKALGYGVGGTILAAVALAVGCPAVWIFYAYGERIRAMSKRTQKARPVS